MKRSAIIRKTPLKCRAKLAKADPHETERDFVRRLLAANASLHAERKARKPRKTPATILDEEMQAGHDATCIAAGRPEFSVRLTKRKPRKPLPRVSAKGKARNAEYARVKATWLAGRSGQCEVRWFDGKPARIDEPNAPGCPYPAVDVHHRAGRRGPLLCNVSWWMAVCRQCHDYLHSHARESRRLGYLVTVKQP